MTTLRDLLNDFAKEIIDITLEGVSLEKENNTEAVNKAIEEAKDDLLDEYIDTIKERIVG